MIDWTNEDEEISYYYGRFDDYYKKECSIQMSSLATVEAIWLGVEDPSPKKLIPGKGWVDVPLEDGVSTYTRMHLSRNQVKQLLPVLQHFARTGELGEGSPLEQLARAVNDDDDDEIS